MRRLLALAALVALTGCTDWQVEVWLGWHESDPDAAVAFANEPWVQRSLADRAEELEQVDPLYNEPNEEDQGLDMGQTDDDLGGGGVSPGECDSYRGLFAAYGLPVDTFARIAWRESGCSHRSYVSDGNDEGGGLLGLNLKGANAGWWEDRCGLTTGNVTDAETNVRCAGLAYDELGLDPWQ